MKLFHFHPVTAEFLSETVAEADPLELLNARRAAADAILEPAAAALSEAVAQLQVDLSAAVAQAMETYAEAIAALDEAAETFNADIAASLEVRDAAIEEANSAAREGAATAASLYEAACEEAEAAAASVEPDIWLVPQFATDATPPLAEEGQAVIWNGEAWETTPDHRGETWFDPARDYAPVVVNMPGTPTELVQALPGDVIAARATLQRRWEILAELAQLDLKVPRSQENEWDRTGVSDEDLLPIQRAAVVQKRALRVELASLPEA